MITLKDDARSIVETDKKYVIKRYKNLSKQENKALIRKLKIGKSLSIDGLITPIDYTLKNGKLDEIYYPYFEGVVFGDLLNQSGLTLPLDVIVDYYEKIEKIVKECHSQEEKIIIPDLLTGGNVLYNPETKAVGIVDYDDCQVGKYETDSISDFIYNKNTAFLLHSPKYYRKGLYSENIDMFSIYTGFIYFATKMNLPKVPFLKQDLDQYLQMVGFNGTSAAQKIKKICDPRQDNPYLEESFKELRDNFTLTASSPGKPRVLVKK